MIKTITGMNYILPFAPHRGKKFWEVARDNPFWIRDNLHLKFSVSERLNDELIKLGIVEKKREDE